MHYLFEKPFWKTVTWKTKNVVTGILEDCWKYLRSISKNKL